MVHDPEWPDKAMFAAYLLILGGAIGLAVEGLRFVGTVKDNLPPGILEDYPHWLSTLLAGVTLVLGVFCLRTQAAVFGYTGALAGLFSLAYAGLLPFLSLLVIYMLVKSKLEGEETRNDGVILHPGLWPDKAMAASLFLVVGGAVILLQGIFIGTGDYEPIVLKGMAPLAMGIDVVVGAFSIWAARQIYHLRRPWAGFAAAGGLLVTFGLYVLGPALAVTTFTFMLLAGKEDEFAKHAGGATARVANRAPAATPAKRGKRVKGA